VADRDERLACHENAAPVAGHRLIEGNRGVGDGAMGVFMSVEPAAAEEQRDVLRQGRVDQVQGALDVEPAPLAGGMVREDRALDDIQQGRLAEAGDASARGGVAVAHDAAGEVELARDPDTAARGGGGLAIGDGRAHELQPGAGQNVERAVDQEGIDQSVGRVPADDREVLADVEVAGGAEVLPGAGQAQSVHADAEDHEIRTVRGVGG
jgi:hypothetical protein